jgi:hypothetical protein
VGQFSCSDTGSVFTCRRHCRARDYWFTGRLGVYLTWHLRQALAELTYTHQDIPRPQTPHSAAPPGLDRRASHEDQIVNLGLMATDFPQYRLSFDRPE